MTEARQAGEKDAPSAQPVGDIVRDKTQTAPVLHESPKRVLALDVGRKRIGLAVSDELGITAQGLDTLHRTRIRNDLAALQEIAAKYNVALLLIGRPLHMSGSESRQSEYTQEFAERLHDHLGIPVAWWDERLTSAEAERMLRESGASLDEKKKSVDRLAAVLLLESYLENQRLLQAHEADLA